MKSFVNLLTVSAAIAVLFCACGKHHTSNKKFYFQAELDGEKITLKDNRQGYTAGVGQSASFAPGNVATRQESNMLTLLNEDAKPVVFWSLGAHFTKDELTYEEILELYMPGDYSYYDGLGELQETTAALVWHDANGTEWTTYYGSGDQSGSSFRVVETEDSEDDAYLGMAQIEFTCTLYDQEGNSMSIADGKARGPFGMAED